MTVLGLTFIIYIFSSCPFFLYFFCVEKRIRQCYRFRILHHGIVQNLRIQKEKYWHINLLTFSQHLFFKTKTLHLVKIRSCFRRHHIIRANPYDIFVPFILCCVKRQCCLTRCDPYFGLGRTEGPTKGVRNIRIKSDTVTFGGRNRGHSGRGEARGGSDGSAANTSGGTVEAVERNGSVGKTKSKDDGGSGVKESGVIGSSGRGGGGRGEGSVGEKERGKAEML